jgi:hypothetical protein
MEEHDMTDEPRDNTPLVRPDSIEIGDFRVDGGYLTANLKVALCNRTENLKVFVEPLGDEIGVEVYEAILDYLSLSVVADHVAAKLNTVAGRALLKMASEGKRRNRRWRPQVRVRLPNPKVIQTPLNPLCLRSGTTAWDTEPLKKHSRRHRPN